MSASEDQSSSLQLGRLELLSTECLDLITQRLRFYDIVALELVGSKVLSSKLAHAVTRIDAQISSLREWTHMPFHYRLRSLELNYSSEKEYIHPFYAPYDRLLPVEGHKTLQKLAIRSSLGFTLLNPRTSLYSGVTLSQLLPNLKTLKIKGDGHFEARMLQNVPRSVTNLHLDPSAQGSSNTYCYSMLNDLPPSLEVFKLRLMLEEDPKDAVVVRPLPPTLTTLLLDVRSIEGILDYLPSRLRKLSLLEFAPQSRMVKISRVPQMLTFLSLYAFHSELSVTLDAPFPPQLNSLILPEECEFVDAQNGQSTLKLDSFLPPSLTFFEAPLEVEANMSDLAKLSSLKKLRLEPPGLDLTKMTHLTYLDLEPSDDEFQTTCKLPTSLIHITTGVSTEPEWLEAMNKLTNLKSLTLLKSTTLNLETFWNPLHTSLRIMTCYLSNFKSLASLCGADWPSLVELHLTVDDDLPHELQDYLSGKRTDNPIKYPVSLRKLTLLGVHDAMWAPIKDLPHLVSLMVSYNKFGITANQGALETASDFLLSLPASLRNLDIAIGFIEPKYFWNLPSGLKELKIRTPVLGMELPFGPFDKLPTPILNRLLHQGVPADKIWTNEHLKSLPPRLESLSVGGIRMLDSFTLRLPPTIIRGDVLQRRPLSTPAVTERARQCALSKEGYVS